MELERKERAFEVFLEDLSYWLSSGGKITAFQRFEIRGLGDKMHRLWMMPSIRWHLMSISLWKEKRKSSWILRPSSSVSVCMCKGVFPCVTPSDSQTPENSILTLSS